MSTAIACTDYNSIMNFQKIGFGTDFLRLNKYYEDEVREFRKATTLGLQDEVLQTLDKIFEECSEEGWDGYDALPITQEAYIEAERLIKSLPTPSFIPMPEITPEPNGEITLEWSKGNRQIFVATVSGRNEITYAGLFGVNKTYGTEYFGDSLPSKLSENLRRLYLKV